MNISSFEVGGTNVDLSIDNGYLSYVFENKGLTYGKKMKLPEDTMGIVAVCVLLVSDVYSTVKALGDENNT